MINSLFYSYTNKKSIKEIINETIQKKLNIKINNNFDMMVNNRMDFVILKVSSHPPKKFSREDYISNEQKSI